MARAHRAPAAGRRTDATGSGGSTRSRPAPIASASAGALACNAHGRGLNLKPIVAAGRRLRPRRCRRRDPHVFTHRERGAVPARHRRLRPVRHRSRASELRAASPRQGSARRRAWRDRRHHRAVRASAFATAISTATISSPPTPRATAFCAAACSRATSRCPTTRRSPMNPTRFNPEDWARLTFYSHTLQAARVRDLLRRDIWRRQGRSTGRTRSCRRRTWTTITRNSTRRSARRVNGYGDDHARSTCRGRSCARSWSGARDALRRRSANMIYGTVRLIEKDDETFLAWARDRYACVIFNLHIEHTPPTIDDGGRRVPRPHRSGHRPRRQLLPDLSPLGAAGSGGALLSADAAVSCAEAAARSGRAVPEHLVPPLPRDVRRLKPKA